MHQIQFRLVLGKLTALPKPLAGLRGPTSKGREGREGEGNGRGEEGKGRGEGRGKKGEGKRRGGRGHPRIYTWIDAYVRHNCH